MHFLSVCVILGNKFLLQISTVKEAKKTSSINIFMSHRSSFIGMGLVYAQFSGCSYEALQDKAYIGLPPGVNFGISLIRPETTQMEWFWSPLDSKIEDLTTTKILAHHTSRITQHILHMALKFYKKLRIIMVVLFDNS